MKQGFHKPAVGVLLPRPQFPPLPEPVCSPGRPEIDHAAVATAFARLDAPAGRAKLVRDRVPELMAWEGDDRCWYRTHDKRTKLSWLLDKLVEEAAELKCDPCPEELADVLEVLEALTPLLPFPLDEARAVQAQKRQDKGGFELGMLLVQPPPL